MMLKKEGAIIYKSDCVAGLGTDYQQLYAQYRKAVKLRELSSDKNFKILKDVFVEKILSAISITALHSFDIMAYLAGLRDVFNYVENESDNVDKYRNELDTLFTEMNTG